MLENNRKRTPEKENKLPFLTRFFRAIAKDLVIPGRGSTEDVMNGNHISGNNEL